MNQNKGIFWMRNDFVRIYAKDLSVYAQTIYMALCCHANKNKLTFIGYRKIAQLLNINKNTVNNHIRELIAYGLVIRLDEKNGRASYLKINSVPFENSLPSNTVIHKENNKDFKDRKNKKTDNYMGRDIVLKRLKETHPDFYKKFYGNKQE